MGWARKDSVGISYRRDSCTRGCSTAVLLKHMKTYTECAVFLDFHILATISSCPLRNYTGVEQQNPLRHDLQEIDLCFTLELQGTTARYGYMVQLWTSESGYPFMVISLLCKYTLGQVRTSCYDSRVLQERVVFTVYICTVLSLQSCCLKVERCRNLTASNRQGENDSFLWKENILLER